MIQEVAARLNDYDRKAINKLMPDLIRRLFNPAKDSNIYIGTINTETFKQTFYSVDVYVVNYEPKNDGVLALYKPTTEAFKAFILFYKPSIEQYMYKKDLTVAEASNFIKSIFIHELIHAKDDILNNLRRKNKKEKGELDDKYFNTQAEVVAFTSQLFEALSEMVDDAIESNDRLFIYRIKLFLREVIAFYSRLTPFSDKSIDLIDSLDNIMPLNFIVHNLSSIKMYNEEGYKKVLKNVYIMVKDLLNKLDF